MSTNLLLVTKAKIEEITFAVAVGKEPPTSPVKLGESEKHSHVIAVNEFN